MNKVILSGRLTRDPEIRYSGEKRVAVVKYTLAVDRAYSREKEDAADFIACTAFGRNAEFSERYLKKGMKISVFGRLQTGSYVNKEGHKVYTAQVIVDEHEFAGSRAGNESRGRAWPDESFDGQYMDVPEDFGEKLPFE